MREIKFRAWSGDKMYYDWLVVEEGKRGVSNLYQYAEKVMQFTGLKDKNGKDIYEGDIILHKGNKTNNIAKDIAGEKAVIEWNQNLCSFEPVHRTSNAEKWDDGLVFPWNEDWAREFEIIGNIYENPELLK